jgi:hypothetical protein
MKRGSNLLSLQYRELLALISPIILSELSCLGVALRLSRTIGPAEEIAHDGLHPLRKRGDAFAQVIADGGTMSWILQHRDEARAADSIHVAGQQVAQPIPSFCGIPLKT